MLNSISVDVEEYFHAANVEDAIGRSCWPKLESRVEFSTEKTLELFAEQNVKATFFILGYIARRHRNLVKLIQSSGHEIASHGFRHRLAYEQTSNAFFRDVYYSKKLLEDITGQEVSGYRAPNFSIQDRNAWAYDRLIEAGYRYDASLYPTHHRRYANLNKPRHAHKIQREAGSLLTFPLAVTEISLLGKSIRLPVAGGAYWRLLPLTYCNWGLSRINYKDKMPFHCYFHPWEIDADQPVFSKMSFIRRINHYGNAAKYSARIRDFLGRFSFGSIKDVAHAQFGPDIFNTTQGKYAGNK